MREAMGGTWLFGIVIVFIVLFASFLTYSISYTRAFNIKNQIIDLIEQHEGFTTSKILDLKNASDEQLQQDNSVEALTFLKIKNAGYNYSTTENIVCENGQSAMTGGYCLTKVCTNNNKKENTYYKVTTYVAVQFPIFNFIFKIPVTGETRTLYYDIGAFDCSK